MGEVFMAICKYGGESAIMKLIDKSTLKDIRTFVENRWPGILRNGGHLSYRLPKNDNCQLLTEDDYQNSIIMTQIVFKLNYIEIYLNGSSGEGCSSVGASSGGFSNVDNGNQLCLGTVIDEDVDGDADFGFYDNDDDMHEDAPLLLSDSWKRLIEGVGQEFDGAEMFREALTKFSIINGFDYRFVKNDKKRITVECAQRIAIGCSWRLHASSDGGGQSFYIREYIPEHTCVLGVMNRSSNRMSSSIVAREIADQIVKCPLTRPADVVKDFGTKYGCDITYKLAFSGVEKARAKHFGNYKTSYDQLRIYMERSMVCNPGSHMVFDKDVVSNRFKRAFISYYASTEGFNYCRPMIFLDATFLTGRFRGQLLCATAKDGNNHLFPIAIGIVDIEDEYNWTWFMRELRIILNDNRMIVFVSDRHKGLLESVSTVFPGHPHSFCTIHIKNNLKTKMSGKPSEVKESLLKKFDRVAYAYTISRFQKNMEEFKTSAGSKVAKWLDTLPPEHYSHAYFPRKRYEEMTSNVAESLNAKYVKL